VSCRDSGPTPVFNGPRRHKVVALTFDDGPSEYTPQILSILRRAHVQGTFFELGDQIIGREDMSRTLLASHEELANHSLRHEYKPSRASMETTSRRIDAATGFKPCLFRPPYGAYDSRVVGDARSLGMTTVNWDVDPTDWTNPGSDAIYQRVVTHVRPGSIVLMHDGGGNRSQTVAALPRIIKNLKGRGYRFATVSELLGQRTVWEPVKPKASKRRSAISRSPLPSRPGEFKPPRRFRAAKNPHGLGRE
jgi:peptidoglycan/xylan/chitin deacetylase (PgdA/CDA1 family)